MTSQAFLQSRSMKIVISAALSLAALGLFLVSRSSLSPPPPTPEGELAPALALLLDRDIDSVLAGCRIEHAWIRKTSVAAPNSGVMVTERRVAIPMDVLPVHVNMAMNVMARRYNANVVAYENVKENTVALNIEFHGTIIHKIVLKPNTTLQRRENKNASPKT